MRFVGPFFVAALLAILAFNVHMYFSLMLPNLVLPHVGTIGAALNIATGLWILVNLLFNYLRCVLMCPGRPGKDEPMRDEQSEDECPRSDHIWRWCSKCNAAKPPRAHHCSVCRRCVLKMDHHCPWVRAPTAMARALPRGTAARGRRARALTARPFSPPLALAPPHQVNNCVGHRTYRHFLLFVLYLVAACCFVLLTAALPTLFHKLPAGAGGRRYYYYYLGVFPTMPGSMAAFQLALAFSAALALSLFGLWHAYLLLSGQTTLEFYINSADRRDARRAGQPWSNPFDHGCRANFEEVLLAPFWSFRWLLLRAAPPEHNGMDWDMRNGRVSAI